MSVSGAQSSRLPGSGDEQGIELRRYLAAVRRNLPLIAVIVVVITGAVVISLSVPPTYQTQAKMLVEEPAAGLGSGDAATMERRLVTTRHC